MTGAALCNGTHAGHGEHQNGNGTPDRLVGEPQGFGLAFQLWRDMEDLHYQVCVNMPTVCADAQAAPTAHNDADCGLVPHVVT